MCAQRFLAPLLGFKYAGLWLVGVLGDGVAVKGRVEWVPKDNNLEEGHCLMGSGFG